MKRRTKIICFILFLIILLAWGGKQLQETLKPAIGILEIDGGIVSSEPYLETIREYEEDDAVKAILIRVDSPGGVVGPSQEVYAALLRLKGKKPLIASLGAVGASGAYYIACAADTIYALPGTMTGSIGVLLEFLDVSEGLSKLGIKAGSITSGTLKDAGTPFRPMTHEERSYFMEITKDVHEQFLEAVAKSRHIPIENLRKYADGRVFTGRQAQKLGLIDKIGGYDNALQDAKRRAGITGEPRILRPKEPIGIFETLGRFLDSSYPISLEGKGRTMRSVNLKYSVY